MSLINSTRSILMRVIIGVQPRMDNGGVPQEEILALAWNIHSKNFYKERLDSDEVFNFI